MLLKARPAEKSCCTTFLLGQPACLVVFGHEKSLVSLFCVQCGIFLTVYKLKDFGTFGNEHFPKLFDLCSSNSSVFTLIFVLKSTLKEYLHEDKV
jgi:hypothetical protein